MAIINAKPTSPGRRGVIAVKSDLYKGKPLKSLTRVKSKNGGRNNNGSLDQLFTGSIDDFAIWDVALDSDAVAAIYNSGSATDLRVNAGNYDNSSNLVAYWDFESQAGPGQDLISGDTGSFGGDPLRVNDAP